MYIIYSYRLISCPCGPPTLTLICSFSSLVVLRSYMMLPHALAARKCEIVTLTFRPPNVEEIGEGA